ncbi:GDCCVxC domain-containing (seleno)protein [Dyadobacter sp. LHD-138]|uniref:GDCCVxC domain-containing (seleno)protein n=1 Tax=Dyadobacter sp. LHD-138 TaxID=3071413 RepID=UPI0027E18E29|nr:GDCCVxC domain-containing (seleno)protein [Dyadobacter sp. LHD-138]MDQ6482559.1 GDCCVxC domain-containing (seleno)protein [Dyadobacter sp. LHD-138]
MIVNNTTGVGKSNIGQTIILQSTITCPLCQHEKQETMPTDACMYFYACEHCHQRLKPLQGDCCIFCSYGTVKCPPIQEVKPCCPIL